MKIGIDISQVIHNGTGVARFTNGLIRSILSYDNEHHWSFFFSSLRRSLPQETATEIEDKGHVLHTQRIPPTLLSFLWNNLHIVRVDRFVGDLDWFITSDWTEPPSKANKATIIHDLTFMRYPETVADSIRKVQQKRLERVKKESTIVFADSHATKKDLIELAGVEAHRILVNYPGVEIQFPTIEQITHTQFKHKLHLPFFLAVGKIEPRKNLKRLVQAFTEADLQGMQLIIVGPQGWDELDMPPNDSVRFLGYVNDTELYSLYALAQAFIFPSIWEGFGYPAIEAMSVGCPVAMSNNSSLGEIGKDAALLFDPFDVNAIKKALFKITDDNTLRNTLIAAGKKRAKQFTWEKYYKKMIKTLSL